MHGQGPSRQAVQRLEQVQAERYQNLQNYLVLN